MIVRVLSALTCAVLMSFVTTTAEARVENGDQTPSAFRNSTAKPDQARNFKAGTIVLALATTSDVALGTSSLTKKNYTPRLSSNRSGSKKTSYKSSKKKSYASSGKKKSYASGRRKTRHASGGSDGGSSRSCLQASARSLLNRIESKFGSVEIVSTCRPGAVIATSGKPSKHRNGMAIDFSAGGRKAAIVQWLIANHHSGGIMTYRDMNHIHVDVGSHFVSLGANSGHG